MSPVTDTQTDSGWKFFLPSRELVAKILQLNNNLGDEYIDKEYEELLQKEGNTGLPNEELITEIDWSKWIQELLSALGLETEAQEPLSNEELISQFQKTFSETIYDRLAMLDRSPGARRGVIFSIREELTLGIAENIGLGLYFHQNLISPRLHTEVENTLLKLAQEFQKWLVEEQKGIYEAPWGTVCLVGKKSESQDCPVLLILDVPI